jgi:hypothetical protein
LSAAPGHACRDGGEASASSPFGNFLRACVSGGDVSTRLLDTGGQLLQLTGDLLNA